MNFFFYKGGLQGSGSWIFQ